LELDEEIRCGSFMIAWNEMVFSNMKKLNNRGEKVQKKIFISCALSMFP